jgi:hypothetical protein
MSPRTGSPAANAGAVLARLTIATVAVLVYRQAMTAGLFEDDFQWLVTRLTFQPSDVVHVTRFDHFYRPLIELYFWGGIRAFDGAPAAFHILSIGVHAANGLLVYAIAQAVTRNGLTAFVAGLTFVVLPAYVDAVAWVGAVAEPLVTLFGGISIVLLARYVRGRSRLNHAGSLAAFAAALLTHESGVTFLPLLVAIGLLVPRGSGRPGLRNHAVLYLPYLVLFAVYGAIDLSVNHRNYLVQEGHYRIGLHAVTNILDYVVALYVGKHNAGSYAAIAAVTVVLLWRGAFPVRFATGWIFITLLPFALFTWGNTSRYAYTPAAGFAMLIGLAAAAIHKRMPAAMPRAARLALMSFLVAGIDARFWFFSHVAVANFVDRASAYRVYTRALRLQYPEEPANRIIRLPAPDENRVHASYVRALAQWEYRDPDLRVDFVPEGEHYAGSSPPAGP